ncbi:unnamed protein product, partial [Allacma fusca]
KTEFFFIPQIDCGCDGTEPKLKVSLYYESLCPSSINFIKQQLYHVYAEMPEYVDLDLVPYGNAMTLRFPNGTVAFHCQHGNAECYGNIVHACAISLLKPEVSASFIYCTTTQRRPPFAGPFCSKQLNISYTPIQNCAQSNVGLRLHDANGNRTAALVPPHEWVPWVTFNNVWNRKEADEIETDLLSVVCKHLNGSMPNVCNEVYFVN